MNVLKEYGKDGQLVRETLLDGTETVGPFTYPPTDGIWSRTVTPMPGFQLNGHRADCRCETCRPDIWRLPGG